MRAHQLNEDDEIINTINVEDLGFMPKLVDASIGGNVGDSIINGKLVRASFPPTVTSTMVAVRDGVTEDDGGALIYAWKITPRDAAEVAVELERRKQELNKNINTWREVANFDWFPFKGKKIACDTLSRSDIDGVAGHITLCGSFPDKFKYAWKATDNTYIAIPDIDTFRDMYRAMAAQGTRNFDWSQELKAKVANATTIEEIRGISWESSNAV